MINRIRFSRKQNGKRSTPERTNDNVPEHVAIIMDGNGRWANKNGLSRIVGHRNGMKSVKRAIRAADELGIKYLTLHAFSTENWKRPKDEVDFLMILPQEFLKTELGELIQKNVQVRMMGDREGLPLHTLSAIDEAVRRTADNDGLVLNLALNYGSRKEMIDCMKEMGRQIAAGSLSPEDISQEQIERHLWSSGLPHPDLVIRTSGELRLSNFMLWQLAYSEMWFTPVYWPEFNENHFYEAVAEFQRRTRRYGGLA